MQLNWRFFFLSVEFSYLFKNEIEFIFILKKLDQLQNTRMTLAMVESFHFAKYTGTSMAWNLVNYFHGIFQICVNIYTCLNGSVCAFSQNITSQFVQFCVERNVNNKTGEEKKRRNKKMTPLYFWNNVQNAKNSLNRISLKLNVCDDLRWCCHMDRAIKECPLKMGYTRST